MQKTLITTEISDDTKAEVDTYLSENSLSMDDLLEAALQHYFEVRTRTIVKNDYESP